MGRFKYKGVKVSVYKEDANTYNFDTEYKGAELFGQDNLFNAKNMNDAERKVKAAINRQLRKG